MVGKVPAPGPAVWGLKISGSPKMTEKTKSEKAKYPSPTRWYRRCPVGFSWKIGTRYSPFCYKTDSILALLKNGLGSVENRLVRNSAIFKDPRPFFGAKLESRPFYSKVVRNSGKMLTKNGEINEWL